jgi:hypothetical protein
MPDRMRRPSYHDLRAQRQAALQAPLYDFVRTYNLLGDPASLSPLH